MKKIWFVQELHKMKSYLSLIFIKIKKSFKFFIMQLQIRVIIFSKISPHCCLFIAGLFLIVFISFK